MITTKISEGLGNQLFQYATGRSLSHDMKTKLYLDLSPYIENCHSASNLSFDKKPRYHVEYLLKHFNIKINGFTHAPNWKVKKFFKNIRVLDFFLFFEV